MGRHRPDAQYPENSIPGFIAALENGADGIEFDVHLSADDEVIVHHDYRLGRTTGVSDIAGTRKVSHLTVSDLNSVELVGSARATLPTLRQVLDAIRPVLGSAELWVELKRQMPPHRGRALVERTLEILTRDTAWPQVVLRSFDNALLVEALRQRPDARTHAMSITRIEHAIHISKRHGFEGIAIFHPLARHPTCALASRAGLTVTAGGEPRRTDLDRLLRQASRHGGIDYICTDHVEDAIATRAELAG